ncbi:flagellar hook-length control protein FliK [Paraglaciecola sp. 20A4]|uniref:flagellar hook-length control protein FliK n=1 Tax=Paraglaciecola sp. 20A4 TaxID=2687288 RepID=UPI0014072FDD|nr:flagellar hook-length control protein FliK [Paraglaciecola sp. 20A4]
MSDSPLTTSTQTTVPQTQQVTTSTNTTRQSAEVVVQQVSPNQVSVSATTQSQAVVIPSTDIQGRLDIQQRYNVSIASATANNASNVVATSTVSDNAATSSVVLGKPQAPSQANANAISALSTAVTSTINRSDQSPTANQVPAPAQKITANPVLQFVSTAQTPVNRSALTNVVSSQQLERILSLPPNQLQAARISPALLTTQAQVTSSAGNQFTLSVNRNTDQPVVNLNVITSAPSTITSGDAVNLKLKPIGNQWQILLTATTPNAQIIPAKASLEQLAPAIKQLLVNDALGTGVSRKQPSTQLTIDSKVLSQVLQRAPSQISNLEYSGLRPTPSALRKVSADNTSLINALQNLPPSKIQLSINQDGSATIRNSETLAQAQPRATAHINITQQNAAAVLDLVKTLKLPVDAQTRRVITDIANSAVPVASAKLSVNSFANVPQGNEASAEQKAPIAAPTDTVQKVSTPIVTAVREGLSQIVNAFSSDKRATLNIAPGQNVSEGKVAGQIPIKVDAHQTSQISPSPTPSTVQSSIKIVDAQSQIQKASAMPIADNISKTANPKTSDSPPVTQQTVSTAPINVQSTATPTINAPVMTPTVKAQAIEVLHTLLRVVQARAEQPSDALSRIANALTDSQFIDEPAMKGLKEQVLGQIKEGVPQGKEQDASQIRQLLTASALSLNATQIISPASGQGMLSGLVTLIQISLASRFARNQPNQGEKLSRGLSSLINSEPSANSNTTGKASTTVNAKGLSEFAQLEQKHQILREISRLFAGHQSSKIGNAEQLLQGQDSFYYTLPSAFGNKLQDIELMIRREHDSNNEEQNVDDGKNNRVWHLTIKLNAGDLGEVLTKAKLREGTLELNFYTSNEQTKHQVMNFLPLFNKRLTALGIDVTKSQCQLGKIPDTLRQRPYHLLQTQV